jgi:hypothetical protein
MNQIAVGDPVKGFFILDGQSIAAPFVKAFVNFKFSLDPYVQESITIQLKGTYASISSALAKLELVLQRALLYDKVHFVSPQYLRFQPEAGGDYYYTPIDNVYLSVNPAGYITSHTGSKVVTLHYTRPNYFDGPQTQLILTAKAGTYNPPNACPLMNHTDSVHGSTVLIDKANYYTVLPAPVRFEFEFDSVAPRSLENLFTGIYHHESFNGETPFFAYYNTLSGGTAYADAAAIQGYYDQFMWGGTGWTFITKYDIAAPNITYFDGRTFRPILHLWSTHAYADLYLRVHITRGSETVFISEPVHSPPSFDYIMLPPSEIPPNYLLREVAAATHSINIYGNRGSGASTTLNIDCLTLFPLSYAASFYGFTETYEHEVIVDDSHRNRYNTLSTPPTGESVGHARVGGPLMLFPNTHCRIFFYCTNPADLMLLDYKSTVKVYYRPRIRLL